MKGTLLILLAAASLACSAQDKPAGACFFPASGFDAAIQQSPDVAEVATKLPATAWTACETRKGCMHVAFQPGSPVWIYRAQGGWTCGYSADRHGASPAWFRSTDLRHIHSNPTPSLSAWAGVWTQGNARIRILPAKSGAGLHLRGHATWHGINGLEHFGDVEGDAKPNGNRLHIAQDGPDTCVLDLVLVDRFILANDNDRCGGMNVRFSGFWQRGASR